MTRGTRDHDGRSAPPQPAVRLGHAVVLAYETGPASELLRILAVLAAVAAGGLALPVSTRH